MSTYWKEKINRLDEFEKFFKDYLSSEAIKSIQYISLRKKTWGGHLILVGITNMDFKEIIETYAPRILKEIREYQETKETDDIYENSRLPKKLEVFEFNLEKKKKKDKEKREEQKKINEWLKNPKDYLEKTDLPNQYLPSKKIIIYKGLIIPIDHTEIIFRNIPAKCRILMNEYDFEAVNKKGYSYRFLETNGKYYKFKNDYKDNLEIRLTSKIGVCSIWEKDCSGLKEVLKQTYLKNKTIKV